MSERLIGNGNENLSPPVDTHLDLDFLNACLRILNLYGDPSIKYPQVATFPGEGKFPITIQYFSDGEIIIASITQNKQKTSQEAPQGACVIIKRDLSKYPISAELVGSHGDPSLLEELINFIYKKDIETEE